MKNGKKLGIGAIVLGGLAVIAGAVLCKKSKEEEQPITMDETVEEEFEELEIEE